VGHYLKQFNEEIIQPRSFAHCGEPCSVACKKFSGINKKDYEPYQALGPQCGIFDQRAAEKLNHWVDAMGIDAIQLGGTIAWIMELVSSAALPPQDFGLPAATELKFNFASSREEFNLEADSQKNADYAQSIGQMILFEPQGQPFRQGIRFAARYLDDLYHKSNPGTRFVDRAVFTSHGEKGSMTPNQYWVPGMLSPMPMMGKYFVYYGLDYLPPFELGKRCVERMVYELFSENTGVCRFHRKWVEAIVDEIISAHYDYHVDYKAHQFELVQRIYERESSRERGPVFWESERTLDIIAKYLQKWADLGLADPTLADWVQRFRENPWEAGLAYWDELRSGIAAAIAAGAEAIPDQVAPYQAARLDIMQKPDSAKSN
jgi:glyceraldehyde-3-phosphate dehydrogenase (ferredoxin)